MKTTNKNNVSSYELISNLNFCIFDLETTGSNQNFDKIIEIGLIKVKNLKIVDKMSYLINPDIPIPEFIQRLTSIRPDHLKDAPKIEKVIDPILKFIGDDILVAHNTSFDIPFLNSVLRRLKKPELKNNVICTNVMTHHLIPNILSSNLTYLSNLFNIPHDHAHRALEDATATAHLLINYLKIFVEKNIQKVNQVYYPKNKFELDRYNILNSEGKTLEELLVNNHKLKKPSIIFIKGKKGKIEIVLPILDQARDIPKVLEIVKDFDWNMVTIKMIGSIIEALNHINLHYQKMTEDNQMKLINYLFSNYLEKNQYNSNLLKKPAKEIKKEILKNEKELHQFCITRHIIPEQLIIYPLFNYAFKNDLIFRFPAHKKKVFNYFNNQLKKFKASKNKIKKIENPYLTYFLMQYIKEAPMNQDTLLIPTISIGIIKEESREKAILENVMDKFSKSNPNPFNFPHYHL